MMWIVYFWAKCPEVGGYLDHTMFDDYEEALAFATEHGATPERTRY